MGVTIGVAVGITLAVGELLAAAVVAAAGEPLLLGGRKFPSHCDCRNGITREMLWCSN